MDPLEETLRRTRPEADREFVEGLTTMIRERERARHRRFRFALAGGLSAALIASLAALGGMSEAAAAPERAVKAVVAVVVGHEKVDVIEQSPACDQYGLKSNAGRGNLSETESGTRQTDSATLVNPHTGGTGPGLAPTDDCDPGNSGSHNHGGD
jgi:hypothetical protein